VPIPFASTIRSWLKAPLTQEQARVKADQELIRRETKRLERKLVRAQQRMAESLYGDDDFIDPSEYPGGANDDDGNYGWGNGGYGGIAGTTNARATGGDWILLRTPMDLRRIRANSRILIESNGYAAGFLDQMVNFIIGKGMEVDFSRKGTKTGAALTGGVADLDGDGVADSDPVVEKAQEIWDDFCKANDWGRGIEDREVESYVRLKRDGEVFLRFFPDEDTGIPKVRFVEPEQIEPPPGDPDPNTREVGYSNDYAWTWGIECDPDDVETRIAYYVRPMNNLIAGFVGKAVPADQIIHAKIGTDRTIKRGITPFQIVNKAFRQCEKINNNMAEVTAIQAAIAYIREHAPTTLPGQAADLIAGAQNFTTTQRSRGGDKIVGNEILQPGSRLDVSAGLKYLAGPTSTGADGYIKVLQSRLRGICARFCMPEFFTGDASNNNMASALVAGGPLEKSAVREQKKPSHLTETVAEKVFRNAADAGLWTHEEADSITVTVTPCQVSIANKLEEAQIRQIEIADKVVSVQTAQQETGRDTAKEAANIKAWQQQFPDTNGQGLGADFEGLMNADKKEKPPAPGQ
jgi:hypothetical protein